MRVPDCSELRDAESNFEQRHIGLSPQDIQTMLREIGVGGMDELLAQAIPASIRRKQPLALAAALSEGEALHRLRKIACDNQTFTSLIGQGYHGTVLPAVIKRNILENPAWYTAYTPYQPEISQGRLEALLNFQTLVADLTGLDIANASLLDEATAAAEAMALARRVAASNSNRFFVDAEVHPQTLAVVRTRAEPLGWDVVVGDPARDLHSIDVFGALFQLPGTFGDLRDFSGPIAAVQRTGGVAIIAADPLALTLLASPGEMGADVAVGSMQRFGVPIGYGGPHAAYIAVKDVYKRALPGRLVGVSVDAQGAPACRLALQTREQHIRREKATSNICTAQVLLAIVASMYAVYHGPNGLTAIARSIRHRTAILATGLRRLGFAPRNAGFFDTISVAVGERQAEIVARAEMERINFRVLTAGQASREAALGITLDETTNAAVVEAVWRAFGGDFAFRDLSGAAVADIPAELVRREPFLTHSVFHRYRTETELLRYMRRLSDRDLALDRTMIPLGSCTMKLNAAAEMTPASWPEFSDLHPFAPAEQAKGYRFLIDELARWLCEITGYDAFSLQPNSGAQGEFAGLLAIRAYHRSRGETGRNVCLIPSSAHGTNPASAHMAGMDVVVVACDRNGNVDTDDLGAKARQHASQLAGMMITYPSTHGVFEARIGDICDIVHCYGGQVYLDGANMNAQVGLCRPGDFGADVGHLNLHKTFCIPHGGGGPGVGPIGAKAHLAAFLPGHAMITGGTSTGIGPVSAAPFGSAAILTISYTYILLMGAAGLRRATEAAILAANYIATRLRPHFPVLYQNENGRVAHECIIDPRPLKDSCGVTVDDIAKRLIDYGFHAPTMSFPVPGTLTIEPTESESKSELDRFCDAMITIRREIADIERARYAVAQSPLRHAPHTAQDMVAEQWTRPYSRSEACFPAGTTRTDKYWPPVGRIDNVYGDRHLICSCLAPADSPQAAG
jgi:glycine cleavage system P protein (glycine dehydrogenase)